MKTTPDNIGDHLYKAKKEKNRPEEETDILLSEIHREEELDNLWEEYLRQQEEKQEVTRQVKATMKIVDSILNWLREEKKAA